MPDNAQVERMREQKKSDEQKKRKRTLLDMLKSMAMGDEPGMAHKAGKAAVERERRRREILQMEQ